MGEIRIEGPQEETRHSYLVKDSGNIYTAKFTVIEEDRETKSAIIRLKLFRETDDETMKELIMRMVSAFFKKGEFFKVTVITDDTVNPLHFIKLGFTLEGLLRDFSYSDSLTGDGYVLGVTPVTFRMRHNENLLVIPGERIELRLSSPADAAEYLSYHIENREFLREYEPVRSPSFYTLRGQENELKERYSLYLSGSMIPLGIYLGGKLIGRINISNIIMGSFRSCTIGYSLHKDYGNRGYMSEAVGMVKDFAFGEMDLHRVEASALPDNIRSQKVLLNNGFRKIGLNPSYLRIGSKWRDHFTYAVTKETEEDNL